MNVYEYFEELGRRKRTLQKTIPGYHFNSIIDTKAFIFIIRIVILTCHVIVGWLLGYIWLTFRGENRFLLSARRCAIQSMQKGCHSKCMEFYSLILYRSAREPNFIYKMRVCKLNRLVQVPCG